MPYRTNATIDLAQLAREAPLGGRERQRRARLGVLASLLAAAAVVALVAHLVPARHRWVAHPYEPPRAAVVESVLVLPITPAAADPSWDREVNDPFIRRGTVPFPGLTLIDVGKSHEAISKEELRQAVSRNAAWLHECYRAARSRNVRFTGVVRVSFLDEPAGASLPPTLASDDVTDPLLLACLARGFEGLVLFAPSGTSQVVELELRVTP